MAFVPANPGSEGTDALPVTYPNPKTIQYLINPDVKRVIPWFQDYVQVTPTYAPLDVRGPSMLYQQQINHFGTVNMKVTQSPLQGRYAPAYVDVTVDGVQYKIQVGATVTVPTCVYDAINNYTMAYKAVIV